MVDSKQVLIEFYKTHPTIHAQDFLSQRQVIEFLGENYETNRMSLWRKRDVIKPYYLCTHPTSGKLTKPLYLRNQIEQFVKNIRIKNGNFDPFQFEKDRMAITRYFVSTKEYLPFCQLLVLTNGYYKTRAKHLLTSRLDYPLIRSTKVFDQRWYNVEDIVHYIIKGNGTSIAENYKKLNLDIDVGELQKMVDR